MSLRRYFELNEIKNGDKKLKEKFHEKVQFDKRYKTGIYAFSDNVSYDKKSETYSTPNGFIDPLYGGNGVVFSFPYFIQQAIPIDKYKKSIEQKYESIITSEDIASRYFLQKLTELNRYYNILTNELWLKYPGLAERIKDLVQWISDLYGTHITKFPKNFNPVLKACFNEYNVETDNLEVEPKELEQRPGFFNETAYFKFTGDIEFLKKLYLAKIGSKRIINPHKTEETVFIRILTTPFKVTSENKIHFNIASHESAYILLGKLNTHFHVFDAKTLLAADCFRNKRGTSLIPNLKIFNQYLSNLPADKKNAIDIIFHDIEQ